jgi:murein DD-endopeptidase MepM/ murein hydrolase activator NlpD
MARKYYSLHVAPRTGAKLREFSVSYPFIVFCVVGFIVLCLVMSGLAVRHLYVRHQRKEIAEKKKELATLRMQTAEEHIRATELAAKVEDIERTTAAFQRTFGMVSSTPTPGVKAGEEKKRDTGTEPGGTPAVETPVAESPAAETPAAETDVDDFDLRKYNEFTYFSKLRTEVKPLEEEVRSRPEGLAERAIVWGKTPVILPLQHSFLSSAFGWRADPFTGSEIYHNAVDLSAWYAEAVFAPADGIVIRTAESPSAGLFVEIFHGFGYSTRFAHLLKVEVRQGQTVRRHEVIGRVGNTGKSTGPHLHYEVRFEGEPVDPTQFMADLRRAL